MSKHQVVIEQSNKVTIDQRVKDWNILDGAIIPLNCGLRRLDLNAISTQGPLRSRQSTMRKDQNIIVLSVDLLCLL